MIKAPPLVVIAAPPETMIRPEPLPTLKELTVTSTGPPAPEMMLPLMFTSRCAESSTEP